MSSLKRREVLPVDGTTRPSPTVAETERFLPSVTVMKHSTMLERKGKHDPEFQRRSHDPPMTDEEAPQEATQLLMLDLRISSKNNKKHRVLIMTSPFIRCVQTAVIVAQEIGVKEIQIHHALGEAVNKVRDEGWDFAYESLARPRSELAQIVRAISEEGEQMRNKAPVTISAVIGSPMGVDDVQESEIKYQDRVGKVLEECAASLEFDGDHIVVIGHSSTLQVFSQHFPEKVHVVKDEPCGFLTLSTPSSHTLWFSGRSRVHIRPKISADPTKKIGMQGGEDEK
jgi:broad specificity phosphatase PhoE